MLESVEELRKDADICTQMTGVENEFETVWITKSALLKDIDAIEREVESNFIELPKDENGEQVSIGDTVHDHEEGYDFRVDGFKLWGNTTEWWAFQDQAVQQKLKNCSIVKPPTVEDVLEEFASERIMLFFRMPMGLSYEEIKEYQEENREACEKLIAEYAAKLQLREAE